MRLSNREIAWIKGFVIVALGIGVILSFQYWRARAKYGKEVVVYESHIPEKMGIDEAARIAMATKGEKKVMFVEEKGGWQKALLAKLLSACIPIFIGIALHTNPKIFLKKELTDEENAHKVTRFKNLGFLVIVAGVLGFIGSLLSG